MVRRVRGRDADGVEGVWGRPLGSKRIRLDVVEGSSTPLQHFVKKFLAFSLLIRKKFSKPELELELDRKIFLALVLGPRRMKDEG
jgi:hypothetical protein